MSRRLNLSVQEKEKEKEDEMVEGERNYLSEGELIEEFRFASFRAQTDGGLWLCCPLMEGHGTAG